VVNRCRSQLRHRAVVARTPVEAVPDAPAAEHEIVARERRSDVLDALARLSVRQREVLTLRYFLDLSEQEIAGTLGISRGAVKSHASRGAAALRQLLAAHLEDER
jgi:RNA polymerase sigma factor (sigma-70 family)